MIADISVPALKLVLEDKSVWRIKEWPKLGEPEKQKVYNAILQPDANMFDVIFDARLTLEKDL